VAPSVTSASHRPQRRDALRNRQRIVDAAQRLVSDRGLGVSHEQIAEAADLAVGTVYRHFPDRSLLIEEALTGHVEAVVAHALAAEAVEDPWRALVEFMQTGLESRVHNQGLHELVTAAGGGLELAIHSRRRIAPIARRIVARCQDAGVVRPDVTVYDLALVPMMIGALGHSARNADPDLWRRHLMIILDGLRYRGAPLPGKPPSARVVDAVAARWLPTGREPKRRRGSAGTSNAPVARLP
jgi:AcrR family transcriptional regulator